MLGGTFVFTNQKQHIDMRHFFHFVFVSLIFTNLSFGQETPITYQEAVQLNIPQTNIQEDYFYFKANVYSNNKTSKQVASGVLNVLLKNANNVVIKQQQHAIINGTVHGGVELPKRIPSGKYTLEAYTQWMLNFDHTENESASICIDCDQDTLPVPAEIQTTTVTVEGGIMVNNLPAKVIIGIPTQDQNIITYGRIIDQKGSYITSVNAVGAGYGAALFTPQSGKSYFFQATDGVKMALPKAVNEGYVFNINTLDEDEFLVQITASKKNKKQKTRLVGYSMGMMVLQKELKFDSHKPVYIELSKKELPAGRMDLYVIDETHTIKSYRPIYVSHKKTEIQTEVVSKTAKETKLKIKILNSKNQRTSFPISLAVYSKDASPIMVDTTPGDIRKKAFLEDTRLLSSHTPKQLETLKIPLKNDKNYTVQTGLNLIGTAYDLTNKILRNERIEVMASSDQGVHIEEVITNDQGILKLTNMELIGVNQIIFRKKAKNVKSRLVKIIPLGEDEKTKNKVVIASTDVELMKKQKNKEAETLPFDTRDAVVLGEINIKKSKLEKRKATPSLYGTDPSPSKIEFQDSERPRTIPQLLQGIPGLVVTNPNDLEPTVWAPSAAGAGGILFVVDGTPLQQTASSGGGLGISVQTNLRDLMDIVSAPDVERIEFLDGVQGAIFGSRAGGGVIVVYTRFANDLDFSRKEGTLKFQGYEPELPFNSYWKDLPRSKRKNAELIYWNSKIILDENGEAIVAIPNQNNLPPKSLRISTVDTQATFASIQNVLFD